MKFEPISFIILKVANRCNLNCTYCYWFKDSSVYEKSNIIKNEVIESFFKKLESHIILNNLNHFTVSLHGGEPLLAGKLIIERICIGLRFVESITKCSIKISLNTNGVLIDDEWIKLFKIFDIGIGVSIDGPQYINDENRVDFNGKSKFDIIVNNIKKIQSNNLKVSILAVCNPNYDPEITCEFIINDLNIKNFDILIPDATYEYKNIPTIDNFYIKLFELWYLKYQKEGINIRIAKNILRALMGKKTTTQTIGYGLNDTCMIKPNGEIEGLDILHTIGNKFTSSSINIIDNEIDDIKNDPIWLETYNSSLLLNKKCQECRFSFACGGGPIGSRWSNDMRFDNPSIYCDQLYNIFETSLNFILIRHGKFEKHQPI